MDEKVYEIEKQKLLGIEIGKILIYMIMWKDPIKKCEEN